MTSPDLLVICVSAFLAVFLLLGFLAAIMRGLMVVYPQKAAGPDTALVAAMTSAAALAFPGTRVTRIEEVR